MTVAIAQASRPRRTIWHVISLGLMAAALVALALLVARIAGALAAGEFGLAAAPVGAWSIVFAMAIYLAGHGFRILRLGMLIGSWRLGLRAIASFHLMTAAIGLLAPLKLGEIYRVVELGNLTGSFLRAVLVAWWERVFDVAIILAILGLAFATTPIAAHAPFYAVAALAGIFILGTAVTFFVVPDNLRRLSILIIRRYDSPRSVHLLSRLHALREAIQAAPWLVRNKLPSLITLTALVWTCEIVCYVLLFPALSGSVGAALEGLLTFLAAVTRGEILIGVLGAKSGSSLHYFAATQAPLALIGLVAGAAYAAIRWKRDKA